MLFFSSPSRIAATYTFWQCFVPVASSFAELYVSKNAKLLGLAVNLVKATHTAGKAYIVASSAQWLYQNKNAAFNKVADFVSPQDQDTRSYSVRY